MFCTNCGKEINEHAVICPNCGVPTSNYEKYKKSESKGVLQTVIKVFMIITCVCSIFAFLIPLAWCLPMTISYCNKIEKGEEISTNFKVCTLLFVNVISGILMLCDE